MRRYPGRIGSREKSRADDHQAERQRGAAERVSNVLTDLRDRQWERFSVKPTTQAQISGF